VLRGSDQAHRLYGVEPGETRIGRDDVLGYMAPEDVDRVFRAARTAYRNRGSLDVEYRVVWPDGSLHWLASVGRCIPIRPDDPDGPVQMVGVHLDIDDRKQFHDALRRSERLASLGTFAAGMAHEINNPVGTILLAARSAQQAVDDHESVRSALQDIVEDAQRTAQIVKNVLRFAQSRAHEQGDLDLNACIRRARVLTRGYASQRGVALELDLDEGPLVVTGNATELEQVFVNLIRNAVESSPKGASISIETRVLGDQVRASVTDRGRGISDSALPRIFDPFFTTRSPEGGIGLGLSICHGIVAAAGGTLEVESQLHSGTTFRVNLPRSRAGAGAVHS
jgi:signal transduction histidine kinase